MYAYKNNILSIPARALYEDWQLISYTNYKMQVHRKKIIRTAEGKGKGNEAYVSFYDLPWSWQELAIKAWGDPREKVLENALVPFIIPDPAATRFFAAHRTPKGQPIAEAKQREKVANCCVLNAIKTLLNSDLAANATVGKAKKWQHITEAVMHLDPRKYPHKLPGNYTRLKKKYQQYLDYGYAEMIHRGEGSQNATKINKEICDWLIATYAQPIKLTIPELTSQYNMVALGNNWKTLDARTIETHLKKPENKRIWTLGRHGKQAYNNEYTRTFTRDRSRLFPNAYWAIDGTKLDLMHSYKDKAGKTHIGAQMKIDVIFDVYSEKIIGYSLSATESHADHFRALRMAAENERKRPYLFTYDNQSGHKMKRMQMLYDHLVARDGGNHYSHRSRRHSSPVEQLFNRLQQQVICKFWFSDKQGVRTKKLDNRMNVDFIQANKEQLPTVAQIAKYWESAVQQWNEAPHPLEDAKRLEVHQRPAPKSEELRLFDLMPMMWLEAKERPITYRREGMNFRLGDYHEIYEVYNEDGSIDNDFRYKNVGRKLIVRYNPETLDKGIVLCDKDDQGDIRQIAFAQLKRKTTEVPVLKKEGEHAQFFKDLKVGDSEYQRDLAALKAVQKRTGITPDQLIENQELGIKMMGSMPKEKRSQLESKTPEFLATNAFVLSRVFALAIDSFRDHFEVIFANGFVFFIHKSFHVAKL